MTEEDKIVWDAINDEFRPKFSKFIVFLLDPESTGNWEPEFRKALYYEKDNSKQIKWIQNVEKDKSGKLIDLIDIPHFVPFVINKEELFEPYSYKDENRFRTWIHDIKSIRDKLAHNKHPSTEAIDLAWTAMERIAESIKDTELKNGLEKIKNRKINTKEENAHVKEKKIEVKAIKENIPIEETTHTRKLSEQKETEEKQKTQNIILIIGAFLLAIILIVFALKPEQKDIVITNNNQSSANNNNNITTAASPSSPTNLAPEHHSHPQETNTNETRSEPRKNEDYSDYVNSSLVNSDNTVGVSVTIIDENNNSVESALSNSIANIYTKSGNKGSTGLIRSLFIKKPEFQELFEGNSTIIQKLKLDNYTDYLAIGKINYSFRHGTEVNGTVICNAALSMNIISTTDKTISQSFNVSANGNGVSESQAQEDAFQKLLYKYNSEHSSL